MKRVVGCICSLGLCLASPVLAADPPLASYGIDIQQTSVSGVSSGAAMAVQMHVAYSSIMRGVGVIAGVAYNCADSDINVRHSAFGSRSLMYGRLFRLRGPINSQNGRSRCRPKC